MKSVKPLTRQDLDPMRCGTPACACPAPLRFSGRCHVGAPLIVNYAWQTGVLAITCGECAAVVVNIAVARGDP